MFIAWEQRNAFRDTLDAMAWERGEHDPERIRTLWEWQFASRYDPVTTQPER